MKTDPIQVELDHVAILVSEVSQSVAFYADVFGLEDPFPGRWGGVPVMMLQPDSRTGVAIFPAKSDGPGLTGRPAGVVDHFAFRTGREGYAQFLERLVRLGIEHEEQDHEISRSVYFKDPDGHTLEVTTYEVD